MKAVKRDDIKEVVKHVVECPECMLVTHILREEFIKCEVSCSNCGKSFHIES